MKAETLWSVIDPFAIRLARFCAWSIVKNWNLPWQERDDIEQQLLLEYYRRRDKYDATRSSPETFVARLLRNAAATLIAHRFAQCRDPRRSVSLEELNNAQPTFSLTADLALRVDVQRAISKLPPETRKLASLLSQNAVADAATLSGVSRRTVYDRISRIRQHFRAQNIGGLTRGSHAGGSR